MRLAIKGLTELRARLEAIRPAEVMAHTLAAEAERLAQSVRDGLSAQPGGDHTRPWTQTGALRDGIGAESEGLEAKIGSNNLAAAPQEMGTSKIPPRPFLAPIAASNGETIAHTIGAHLAAVLRGELIDPDITPASPAD